MVDYQTVAVVVVALVAGMAVPFQFAMERLNGLGRWMMGKLPYEPPPGKDEAKAMEEAAEDG